VDFERHSRSGVWTVAQQSNANVQIPAQPGDIATNLRNYESDSD
jgi:hypothetical protein